MREEEKSIVLRFVRNALLVVVVLFFVLNLPMVFFPFGDILFEVAVPRVELSCALGGQSLQQDAPDVRRRVESILAEQGLAGTVRVSRDESTLARDRGWAVEIEIPVSLTDMASAGEMADRASSGIAQTFPESKLTRYEYKGKQYAQQYSAMWHEIRVFAAAACTLSLLGFYLLLRWRPRSCPHERTGGP